MRRVLLSLVLLFALWTAPAVAADISGKWDVKIVTPDGEIHGLAAFTQDGNKVTGWLGPSESDPIPITMSIQGSKLTIWTHPQAGRNVVFERCDVVIKGDKMSGMLDGGKGTIEFTKTSHAHQN